MIKGIVIVTKLATCEVLPSDSDYINYLLECEENKKQTNKILGQQISYGDSFQLFHSYSRRYLSLCEMTMSSFEVLSQKEFSDFSSSSLGFSSRPNESTTFVFEPYLHLNSVLDSRVKSQDDMYLLSLYKGIRVHLHLHQQNLIFTKDNKTKISISICNSDKNTMQKGTIFQLNNLHKSFILSVDQSYRKDSRHMGLGFKPITDNFDLTSWFICSSKISENTIEINNVYFGQHVSTKFQRRGSNSDQENDESNKSNDDVEVLALTDNPNSKAKFNIRLHQPKDQDENKCLMSIQLQTKSEHINHFNPNQFQFSYPFITDDTLIVNFADEILQYEIKLCTEIHKHLQKCISILSESNDFINTLVEIKFALAKLFYLVHQFVSDKLSNAKIEGNNLSFVKRQRAQIVIQSDILNDFLYILELIYTSCNEIIDGEKLTEKLSLNNCFDNFSNPLCIMFESMYLLCKDYAGFPSFLINKINLIQSFIFIENSHNLMIYIFKAQLRILNNSSHSKYIEIKNCTQVESCVDYVLSKVKEDHNPNYFKFLSLVINISGYIFQPAQDKILSTFPHLFSDLPVINVTHPNIVISPDILSPVISSQKVEGIESFAKYLISKFNSNTRIIKNSKDMQKIKDSLDLTPEIKEYFKNGFEECLIWVANSCKEDEFICNNIVRILYNSVFISSIPIASFTDNNLQLDSWIDYVQQNLEQTSIHFSNIINNIEKRSTNTDLDNSVKMIIDVSDACSYKIVDLEENEKWEISFDKSQRTHGEQIKELLFSSGFHRSLLNFIQHNYNVLEKCLSGDVNEQQLRSCVQTFSSIFVCLQNIAFCHDHLTNEILKEWNVYNFKNIRFEQQVGELGLILTIVNQINENSCILDLKQLTDGLNERLQLSKPSELIECTYETPIEIPAISLTYTSNNGVSKSEISHNNESRSREIYSIVSENINNNKAQHNKNTQSQSNNGVLCSMCISSLIFEIYSKLAHFVDISFTENIISRIIYEDKSITVISKQKSIVDMHKTMNFISCIISVISLKKLEFIREKLRKEYTLNTFFDKITVCLEIIKSEEQKEIEDTFVLINDMVKSLYLLPELYYHLHFNTKFCDPSSLNSLNNFYSIFLMNYKDRLNEFIENSDFETEESVDIPTLKFLSIYLLQMMHQIKKFIEFNNEPQIDKPDFRFDCNSVTALVKNLMNQAENSDNPEILSLAEISKLMLENDNYKITHVHQNTPRSQEMQEEISRLAKTTQVEELRKIELFESKLNQICETEEGMLNLLLFYRNFSFKQYKDIDSYKLFNIVIKNACKNR